MVGCSRPKRQQFLSTLTTHRVVRCCKTLYLQAMLHEGSIYLTTSEFYGKGTHRVPSIYWAIVEPGSLATGAVTVHGSGLIASKDGLMLGFPVIAALSSGDGAIIAYSYARAGDVDGIGPAYPGEHSRNCANGLH